MLSKLFLAITVFTVTSGIVFAQPGLPGDPAQAPLGGGWLIAVAVSGIIFAWRMLKQSNKEN